MRQRQLAKSYSVINVGRYIPGSVIKEEMYVTGTASLGTKRDFVKLMRQLLHQLLHLPQPLRLPEGEQLEFT